MESVGGVKDETGDGSLVSVQEPPRATAVERPVVGAEGGLSGMTVTAGRSSYAKTSAPHLTLNEEAKATLGIERPSRTQVVAMVAVLDRAAQEFAAQGGADVNEMRFIEQVLANLPSAAWLVKQG